MIDPNGKCPRSLSRNDQSPFRRLMTPCGKLKLNQIPPQVAILDVILRRISSRILTLIHTIKLMGAWHKH